MGLTGRHSNRGVICRLHDALPTMTAIGVGPCERTTLSVTPSTATTTTTRHRRLSSVGDRPHWLEFLDHWRSLMYRYACREGDLSSVAAGPPDDAIAPAPGLISLRE